MYVKKRERERERERGWRDLLQERRRGERERERESAVDAKRDSQSPSSLLFSSMFYVM
jgi:hypothetical protein